MKHLTSLFFVPALLLGSAACTHVASQELSAARTQFAKAESGIAAEEVPTAVYQAKKALKKAEKAHQRDPNSTLEQDLGYIAARRAQYAIAKAEMRIAERDLSQARQSRVALLKDQRDSSLSALDNKTSELQDKEQSLESKRQRLAEANKALENAQSELSEKQKALAKARKEAQQLSQELTHATEKITELAEMTREEDKLVITLSGQVLFKTDSSNLLPGAERKLEEVAAVLGEYDGHNIVVEGHTDSRGSADYNATLSLRRARAVENFLTDRGVSRDNVDAVGRGESDPIAPNTSPEGRANNRRVEIVIDNKQTVASR